MRLSALKLTSNYIKPLHILMLLAGTILPLKSVNACSLQFNSPQRGVSVSSPTITVTGTGSGVANTGAIGTVTATINGSVFFQQAGQFTRLIDFLGSGAATVTLTEGPNLLSVSGSVNGCSASDSMVIFYTPLTPEKEAGEPDYCIGNPINILTGNKYQQETLNVSFNGTIPTATFTYNSSLSGKNNGLGYGWTFVGLKRIVSNGQTLLLENGSGMSEVFTKVGNSWQGDPDTQITIESNATGYRVQMQGGAIDTYDLQGKLSSYTTPQNQTITYDYNELGLLSSMTSEANQAVIFDYDVAGQLLLMIDPEGNQYHYAYDGIGNLTSVTYPDDTPSDLTDNPVRTYHYENTTFPHHLTGLTDETGSRVTWVFDTQGRAISSELDGGVDKVTLDYSTPDQVTVTNPLGKDTTYHFTTLHGVKKVTQVEGHATPSCVGANQNYTYDANGYLQSKTDWQGNTTTYIHDARGLEVSRTEASGTADTRTITTTWHPDFRLPLTITEPGKVTTFTYDGQGRQLTRTTNTP